MKLVVDIGNTKAKAGVFDGKTLVETRVYADFSQADFRQIKRDYPVSRTLVCAVAACPDWMTADGFADAAFWLWHRDRPGLRYPVEVRHYDPATLGFDRIAIGVALRCLCPGRTVLGIGMGTCITYNLVTADGLFEPGPISPGVCMRGRAMHVFTHALPQITPDWQAGTWPVPMPVDDTGTALRAGMVEGTRYELEGFVARYRAAHGAIPVYLTGGDAGYFEFSPKKRIFASPNLGLIGLNEILDYNK